MRIIDSYNEMQTLIARCKTGFDMTAWEGYARGISPELPEKCKDCSSDYDFETQVLPVLDAAIKSPDKLETAHASFVKAVDLLPERVQECFNVQLPMDIVFYMGLCCGAGWATTLDSRPAVLLGAEKILELDWQHEKIMKSLVYHEVGHLLHFSFTADKDPESNGDKAIWQLFSEGVAMYCEHTLRGDKDYYYQDKNGWLDWCKANKKELFEDYLAMVRKNESTSVFFGDWYSYKGYSDIGYFLGAQFVEALDMPFEKIAVLDILELKRLFSDYVGSIDGQV